MVYKSSRDIVKLKLDVVKIAFLIVRKNGDGKDFNAAHKLAAFGSLCLSLRWLRCARTMIFRG